MLQLNNTMDKLESDLSINKCSNRCEDFVVIDHAESLIPGKFRHEFVKKKDELLRENDGSHYKALSSFLKTETSLIQKYMPDKVVEDVSKETKDPKKMKETKAKVAKIKAKVTDAKATENSKKKLSMTKKLPRKRLGNVQVAISSITTFPEEKAQRVKVSLQHSLPPVLNILMQLSKPEPQ